MAAVETIVIVGAGQAGGQCAETLRSEGYDGRVLLVGDEPVPPYERPPLSKAMLGRDALVDPPRIELRAPDRYRELEVDLMLGRRVCRLCPVDRQIVIDGGTAVTFDRCILATGGRARPWLRPVAGDGARVMTLRTVADAHALRERLWRAKRLTVVGGGFLGLECADAAAALGLEVTVIESGGQLLGRRLPASLAGLLAQRHAGRGVRFRMNTQVARIDDDASCSQVEVELDDGERIASDVCLVATGQLPNDELAAEAGLKTGNGIHVDAYCRTSAEHVYAAGDCASFPFGTHGSRIRLESWQNADQHARAAARNALGQIHPYTLLPWFWTDQTGWNIQFVGLEDATDPALEWIVRESQDDAGGKAVWIGLRDGVIVAAVAVNSGSDVQPLRALTEAGVKVDRAIMADTSIRMSKISKSAVGGMGK